MLEKPNLADETVISSLQAEFGLRVSELSFLPLGADVNTAVYRVVGDDQSAFFLKLRAGNFEPLSVSLPLFLKDQGIRQIIPPLLTCSNRLWAGLDPYKMILYPFVEGQDGYELALTDQQWLEFGAALQAIHAVQLPPTLEQACPRETFPAHWREMVSTFQAQVEQTTFADPTAAKLAAFMKTQRSEIRHLVERAGQLAAALADRPLEPVLCHADIHPGNLLITPHHDFFIVDWDNPILAPRERDLMFIGSTDSWNGFREKELFYQGYGPVEINQAALAYYRYERIVQDIAEFCEQLLLSDEGGPDREQSLGFMVGQFKPHQEVAIARQTDHLLTRL
jgi:spectinomycin phosphotransferase